MPILNEKFKMNSKYNWYLKLIRKYYQFRVKLLNPKSLTPDSQITQKAQSEGFLIIQIPFGGIGDHLVYSSLPELLWKQKKIKTFISEKTIFRSKAIKDFIWGLNPYIEFTHKEGWFCNNKVAFVEVTIDKYLQRIFELEGDGCPKIYYNPHIIPELKNKIIIDPSFGPTGRKNGYLSAEFHNEYIKYIKENIGSFTLLVHTHSKIKNPLEEKIKEVFLPSFYDINNLEQLCDAFYSASERYLLHTGTASIAAALGLQNKIINYEKPSTYNNFLYPMLKHIHLKNQELN